MWHRRERCGVDVPLVRKGAPQGEPRFGAVLGRWQLFELPQKGGYVASCSIRMLQFKPSVIFETEHRKTSAMTPNVRVLPRCADSEAARCRGRSTTRC